MMLALHGDAGGLDELAIAVIAFGVLWLAVKLAGRKSAEDGDDEDEHAAEVLARNQTSAHAAEEHQRADPAPPTGTSR